MALSHAAVIVSRLYIFFVCFFLGIAPQGKIFLVIIRIIDQIHIQISLAYLIVFSRGETGGNSPHHRPRSGPGGGGFFWDISGGGSLPGLKNKKNTGRRSHKVKIICVSGYNT